VGTRISRSEMLAKRNAWHNVTKVLGLADKIQRGWHLGYIGPIHKLEAELGPRVETASNPKASRRLRRQSQFLVETSGRN
jgi:hypothetical protein